MTRGSGSGACSRTAVRTVRTFCYARRKKRERERERERTHAWEKGGDKAVRKPLGRGVRDWENWLVRGEAKTYIVSSCLSCVCCVIQFPPNSFFYSETRERAATSSYSCARIANDFQKWSKAFNSWVYFRPCQKSLKAMMLSRPLLASSHLKCHPMWLATRHTPPISASCRRDPSHEAVEALKSLDLLIPLIQCPQSPPLLPVFPLHLQKIPPVHNLMQLAEGELTSIRRATHFVCECACVFLVALCVPHNFYLQAPHDQRGVGSSWQVKVQKRTVRLYTMFWGGWKMHALAQAKWRVMF